MNDEDELSVKDSQCNTCRHGMCMQDKDVQSFFTPPMMGQQPPSEDMFNQEQPPQPAEPEISEVSFPTNKVRSICFWRPEGTQTMAPVVFNVVSDCSRYEKRNR